MPVGLARTLGDEECRFGRGRAWKRAKKEADALWRDVYNIIVRKDEAGICWLKLSTNLKPAFRLLAG
jgi:hypothetical protein